MEKKENSIGCWILILIIPTLFTVLSIKDGMEARRIRKAKELIEKKYEPVYDYNVKNIVSKYSKGKLKKLDSMLKIDGAIFCVYIDNKKPNGVPYSELNHKLFEIGNNVATSPDSLKFLIVCEKERENVGHYTNGYNAYRVTSTISIIDVNNESFYIVDKNVGDNPPRSISGDYDGYGSSYSITDFLNKIDFWIN